MNAPVPRPGLRWFYRITAYGCVGLAGLGVVLPGLPATPFLLVAAWAAPRGSDRLHGWLHRHPQFGPLLRDWQEQRAIDLPAKVSAVVLLILSWGLLVWYTEGFAAPLAAAVFFTALAAFVLSRPRPRHKAG